MIRKSIACSSAAAVCVFRVTLACIALACFARDASAQTSYPMLMSAKPVALQVGTTAEVTIQSRYSMRGAFEVLISGAGVTGEVVPPPPVADDGKKPADLTSLKVRFTATADAEPGVRDFRLATPQGASTLGQLVIVRDPVVSENGANDRPEQALAFTAPATLCGAIEKAEDVDYFKFKATAGQALTFHVRSSRLEDRIHDLQTHSDPILTLRNSSGVTIAASDNYFYGDPLLSYKFEQEGEYLVEIRDVRYQGNNFWEYCIEIHGRPFVETVHPLAVAAGQPSQLELVGYQLPAAKIDFTPPADMGQGEQSVRLPVGGDLTDPVPVLITGLPLTSEGTADNSTSDKAVAVSLPAGINGRMEAESDVDYYAFEAKKGEAFTFEIHARRRGSSLDSHLRVLNDKGQQLALNDDLKLGKRNFADSWIENWTAPADGKYVLEVRDVHLRGGPAYPYFLKATRSLPYFELYVDTDKTQISPGGCGVIYCRVERKGGFTGAVDLHIDGLPHGVTARCGRILPDAKTIDGCIVLEADADAPMSVSNVRITGTSVHKSADGQETPLTAVGVPYQEIYLPGGGRGHWPVGTHAVAVSDYGDIRFLTLSDYDIRLKPGESKKIDIHIERSPEFAANVTLEMIYQHLGGIFGNSLPPGITIDDKNSKTLLAGGATQGHITIKAAPDAPETDSLGATDGQLGVVMANVSINFVMKATYASRPVTIRVAK